MPINMALQPTKVVSGKKPIASVGSTIKLFVLLTAITVPDRAAGKFMLKMVW
mgnify:CR=1 FL=1